jgi:hypothetical protein
MIKQFIYMIKQLSTMTTNFGEGEKISKLAQSYIGRPKPKELT